MYQLGDCLHFYKTFNGPARASLVIMVGVVNLKSVLNCGNPPVKLLLSSAINIWRGLLNQGVEIYSTYTFTAQLVLFREATGGLR